MSLDPNPENSPKIEPSQDLNSLSHPKQDTSTARNALRDSSLLTIQVHDISPELFERVMQSFVPEISSTLAEHLHQAAAARQSLVAADIFAAYFNDHPIEIRQSKSCLFGSGSLSKSDDALTIVRHDEDDVIPLELTSSARAPGVTLRILLSLVDGERRYGLVEQIGEVLGRRDLPDLIAKLSPPPQGENDSGLATVPLSPSISVVLSENGASQRSDTDSDLLSQSRWAPRRVQCASPLYSERNKILSMVAPQTARELIDSGLLNTAENFAENHSSLNESRLTRISSKLSMPIEVEFSRWICLGEPGEGAEAEPHDGFGGGEHAEGAQDPEGEFSDSAQQEEIVDELFGEPTSSDMLGLPSEDGSWQEDSELSEDGDAEISEPSEFEPEGQQPESVEVPDEALDSEVIIRGMPSAIGDWKLTYRSHAAVHGVTHLVYDDSFDFNSTTMEIEFEEGGRELSRKASKSRWQLVKRLGDILNSPVDTASIRSNLSSFNDEPESCQFGIDLTTGRLAIFIRK